MRTYSWRFWVNPPLNKHGVANWQPAASVDDAKFMSYGVSTRHLITRRASYDRYIDFTRYHVSLTNAEVQELEEMP